MLRLTSDRRYPSGILLAALAAWPCLWCVTVWAQPTDDQPPAIVVEQDTQEVQTDEQEVAETDEDDESEIEIAIDSEGSLEITREDTARVLSLSTDVRFGYFYAESTDQDGTESDDDEFRVRWRAGLNWNITDMLRSNLRFAIRCSSESCDPDTVFTIEPEGIQDGELTIDEAFLHWYRNNRFDFALGRMQTKFVTRSGVFAKSLDRNDSNNTRITWTDGFHGTYQHDGGWTSHAIVQYNADNAASSVRRGPLDFADSSARASYFVSFENLERKGHLSQRAIDLSYLPKSLQKDGSASGRLKDYWGIVARLAGRWPAQPEGRRLRFSAEIGYAPETPTNAAANIPGDGDADGMAWAVTASVMDIFPRHSIGLNYCRIDSGWLLSPQYKDNSQLTEIRYIWLARDNLNVSVRARWQEDLEQQVTAANKQDDWDVFLRLTWTQKRQRSFENPLPRPFGKP